VFEMREHGLIELKTVAAAARAALRGAAAVRKAPPDPGASAA